MSFAFSPRAVVGPTAHRWVAAVAFSAAACTTATGQLPTRSPSDSAQKTDNTFTIPNDATSYDTLKTLIKELDSRKPPGESQQEVIAHQRKVARTITAIAKRALALELEEEQAMQMAFFRLQSLNVLAELGEPHIDQQLTTAIDTMRHDPRQQVAAIGMKFYIESGLTRWNELNDPQRKTLTREIVRDLKRRRVNVNHLRLLMSVVDFLSDFDGQALAAEMLAELLPRFRQSDDPQIAAEIQSLEGINRRLHLQGKRLHLSGLLLDATPLNWKSYRGKVVLVDFWSTSCGPCRAEISNILRLYQSYHEKGFDVVGVCLDTQPELVRSYLEQKHVPWATLFEDDPTQRSWKHPMAVKYGVTGLPRAMLVDRDGRVIHMNARGPVLARELRRLLGEPLTNWPAESAPTHHVAKPILQP